MTWRHQAACAGETTDLFFPIGTSGPAYQQAERARQVCMPCPVRTACLEWALNVGIEHGIWGGLTEEERRALKRRTTRARARAVSDLRRDVMVVQEAMTAAADVGRSTASAAH